MTTLQITLGETQVQATAGSYSPKHLRYVVSAERCVNSRKIGAIRLECRVIAYRGDFAMDYGIERFVDSLVFETAQNLNSKKVQSIIAEKVAQWSSEYAHLWS